VTPLGSYRPGLYGHDGQDWLDGGNGNDFLDGGVGNDVLLGGAGNDTYLVESVADQVFEAAGGGTDIIQVGAALSFAPVPLAVPVSGTFALATYAEVEVLATFDATAVTALNLTGSTFSNQITGQAGANTLAGLGGDDGMLGLLGHDRLDGGSGNDKLDGGLGNDLLKGGTGKDTLTGGAGRDVFVFNTAPSSTTNVDRIVDFRWQDDTVQLDNAGLKKVGSNGKLKSDAFHLGKKAADAEDRVIYDKGTGSLYYDADGTGKSAAIKIAILSNKATLKLSDFFVI
jgi:Ca2+-binding RTX toxin-like protein